MACDFNVDILLKGRKTKGITYPPNQEDNDWAQFVSTTLGLYTIANSEEISRGHTYSTTSLIDKYYKLP